MNLKASIGESGVGNGRPRVVAIAVAIGLAACAGVIAVVVLAGSLLLVAAVIAGCLAGILAAVYPYRRDLLRSNRADSTRQAAGRAFIVPIEPPLPPRNFEGRNNELKSIHEYVTSPAVPRPVLVTITGPAGIGKTALASMYASRYRYSFPDGQLFARMEHAAGRGSPSYDILGRFLSALQFLDDPVAESPADRREQYAGLTQDRSLLVIIDDACHPRCVTELLPSGHNCVAIVISRKALDWLLPSLPVELRPLSLGEGIRLLQSVVGQDRVESEPVAASELAGTGHPLAIRLAATALTGRPYWSLGLASATAPAGEPRAAATPETAIESNLDLIYALLSKDERRALRCIALLDGPVFMAWELAALLGKEEPDAVRLADNLARIGLVRRTSGGRAGIVEFSIDEHIQPYLRDRMFAETTDAKRAQRLESLARARAERAHLDAGLAGQLYRAISESKDSGRLSVAFDKAESALAAARESAQPQAEALALATIADLRLELGNLSGAEELATAAERLAGEAPARALRCLGRVRCQQGDPQAGTEVLDRAVAAARRADDAAEEVRALLEQANALALAQQRDRGIAAADLAITSCRQRGDCAPLLTEALCAAARVRVTCGEPRAAMRWLHEAVVSASDSQVLWRAWIEFLRGRACFELGDHEGTISAGANAIEQFGEMSHRYGVASCRLLVGRAYAAQGRLAEAIAAVADALETLQNCGDPYTADEAKRVLGSLLVEEARASRDREELEQASQLLEDAGDDNSLLALQAEFPVAAPQARWWQPGAGRARQPSAMQRASR